MNRHIKPILVGGIGEKKSNSGKQWYQQNRIYDSNSVAMCLPANLPGGSYWYLVEEEDYATGSKISRRNKS